MADVSVKDLVAKTRGLPDRTISGDAYQVLRDGEVYTPHSGEEVTIRGEVSNGFIEDLMRFQVLAVEALGDGTNMLTVEVNAEMAALLASLRQELAKHVVSWTWTDSQGLDLPPPTLDTLRDLPFGEFFFLVSALMPSEVTT